TLVIAGLQPGGQLMITNDVENYPGFPKGIMGPEMMELFKQQALRFGAKVEEDEVSKVDFSSRPFKVWVDDDEYLAKSVIVATGATARYMGLANEQRLQGRGVSACATCDGAFFKEKKLVVIGGGDSAMEEATFLTRFASEVNVVHRRNELRASKIMQKRAHDNPKVKFIWDSVIEDVLGENRVEGVKLKNLKTGESSDFACDGVFLAIGHDPNTKIFKQILEMDEKGYLVRKVNSMSSVEGVFLAGDVHDTRYRQAITAAGAGCQSGIDAERWLEDQNV
ncbi:MAG: thioredoxin-disulfide reductase, partial [Planctomycetota bacterium]